MVNWGVNQASAWGGQEQDKKEVLKKKNRISQAAAGPVIGKRRVGGKSGLQNIIKRSHFQPSTKWASRKGDRRKESGILENGKTNET